MTREDALPYVSYMVDDALAERRFDDIPGFKEIPANARLVGWQCGFEPLFVAVWSYLGVKLDPDDAVDIAVDLLEEKKWFAEGHSREPDYVI